MVRLARFGDLTIDLNGYLVRSSGRVVSLTAKEYELLRVLASDPGRVFTRQTLLQKVWGLSSGQATRTLDVHVRRLRSKIESKERHYVETVRKVGYRFVAPPQDS